MASVPVSVRDHARAQLKRKLTSTGTALLVVGRVEASDVVANDVAFAEAFRASAAGGAAADILAANEVTDHAQVRVGSQFVRCCSDRLGGEENRETRVMHREQRGV